MIRSKWLERAEWERKLRSVGAEPLPGKGKLNTAEWWYVPGGTAPFTVPVEDDGTAEFWAIQKLAEMLAGPRTFTTLSADEDGED